MWILGGTPDVAHEDDAFAAFGLQVERPQVEPFSIWPENVETVTVFQHMTTQWQVAPAGGLVGMRYEALPMVCAALKVPRARRSVVLFGIRLMEIAAVSHVNKKS